MNSTSNRKFWPALDGLRAIAVSIVLLAHGRVAFVQSGAVGVDVFFVLSGFLVTSILSAEMESFGRINLKNFYARRFLRLVPCLLMVTAFFCLWAAVIKKQYSIQIIGFVLTYTSNWARALWDVDFYSLSPTWSLGAEEQYYLVWPFAIVLLHRVTKSLQSRFVLLLGLALLLAFYRFLMVGHYSPDRIYFGLDTHMDGLVMGSALSYGIHLIDLKGKISPSHLGILFDLIITASIAGLLWLMIHFDARHPFMGKYGFFCAAVLSVMLIITLVVESESFLKKLISSGSLQYLGKISYGIYLWHRPIYSFVEDLFPERNIAYLFPIKIVLLLAVSSISYFGVEAQFLKLKDKFRN